jgi:hypothetical protein
VQHPLRTGTPSIPARARANRPCLTFAAMGRRCHHRATPPPCWNSFVPSTRTDGLCPPAVSDMSYPYQTLARQDMWRDASRIRKPNQSTRNERAREGRVRTTTWMNRSLERLRLARQRHAACHRCPRMVRPVRLGQAPCPPRSCCCTRARRCRRAWQTAACATTRSGVAEPATCPHHQASGTQISAHKVGVCAIENHV